jgi:hypothetical protein
MPEINGKWYDDTPFRRDDDIPGMWYDPPVYCDCRRCGGCALNGQVGYCVFELKMGEDLQCEDCRAGRCRN